MRAHFLHIACPHCCKRLKVGGDAAGRQLRCPNCTKIFEAPLTLTAVTATPPQPNADAVTVNSPQLSDRKLDQLELDLVVRAADEVAGESIVYTGECARLLALGGVGIVLILVSHILLLTSARPIRWDLLVCELPITVPFVILNFVAARNLRALGSRALVIAGCTSSLIAGAVLTLASVMEFMSLTTAMRTHSAYWPVALISFVVVGFAVIFLIVGSTRALICVNRPDVQELMK